MYKVNKSEFKSLVARLHTNSPRMDEFTLAGVEQNLTDAEAQQFVGILGTNRSIFQSLTQNLTDAEKQLLLHIANVLGTALSTWQNLTDTDVEHLADALGANPSIWKINLQHCRLTVTSIRHIATALLGCQKLERISITDTPLYDSGIKLFAQAVARNPRISWLYLVNNYITDDQAKELLTILESHQRVSHLFLSENRLHDMSARHCAQLLIRNQTLNTLDVNASAGHFFTDAGIRMLATGLRYNYGLRNLELQGHRVTDLKPLEEMLTVNFTLQKLSILPVQNTPVMVRHLAFNSKLDFSWYYTGWLNLKQAFIADLQPGPSRDLREAESYSMHREKIVATLASIEPQDETERSKCNRIKFLICQHRLILLGLSLLSNRHASALQTVPDQHHSALERTATMLVGALFAELPRLKQILTKPLKAEIVLLAFFAHFPKLIPQNPHMVATLLQKLVEPDGVQTMQTLNLKANMLDWFIAVQVAIEQQKLHEKYKEQIQTLIDLYKELEALLKNKENQTQIAQKHKSCVDSLEAFLKCPEIIQLIAQQKLLPVTDSYFILMRLVRVNSFEEVDALVDECVAAIDIYAASEKQKSQESKEQTQIIWSSTSSATHFKAAEEESTEEEPLITALNQRWTLLREEIKAATCDGPNKTIDSNEFDAIWSPFLADISKKASTIDSTFAAIFTQHHKLIISDAAREWIIMMLNIINTRYFERLNKTAVVSWQTAFPHYPLNNKTYRTIRESLWALITSEEVYLKQAKPTVQPQ